MIAGVVALVVLGTLGWSYVVTVLALITHGEWLWLLPFAYMGFVAAIVLREAVDETWYEVNHGHRREH